MQRLSLTVLALPVVLAKLRGVVPKQQRHALHLDHDNRLIEKRDLTFGKPTCPCVGIDNLPGELVAEIGNLTLHYPGGTGSHCDAWEHGVHPDCQSETPPSWCAQQWCYVNPCHCDIPAPPEPSEFFPTASYQGMPLYFSYATCGYDNAWTKEMADHACSNMHTADSCSKVPDCEWLHGTCYPVVLTKVCQAYEKHGGPSADWGSKECPCVGIKNLPGQFHGSYNGAEITIPAEVGSKCEAWYPQFQGLDCQGDHCQDKWCYVDPCHCNLTEVPSKKARFLEGSSFQGKPVYYSFATCGNPDRATEEFFGPEPCTAATDETSCTSSGDECHWVDGRCVAEELHDLCKAFQEEALTKQLHSVEIIDHEQPKIEIDSAEKTADEVRDYRASSLPR